MPDHNIQEDSFSSDEDLDSENDSESSSDADAKLAEDDVFDIEFLKCYSALKKKDEKIYNKEVKFFTEQASDSDDVQSNKSNDESPNQASIDLNSKRTKKPQMTLLDHQLYHDTIIDQGSSRRPEIDLNRTGVKSFYEKDLDEIKKSIAEIGDNVQSDSDDDFLVAKNSDSAPKPRSKINAMLDQMEKDEYEDVNHLKQLWSDPDKLSEEDRYLRDFILNKRYLAPSVSDPKKDEGFFSKNLDELSDVDEDEKVVKKDTPELRSDEKDFEKITRIPRNSTKTIRDLVEKREKKEKRLKKVEKEKKKKVALKKADCEDMVGDLPTRFQYVETEPNDYGLSAEELLMATDEELEKWISLKETLKCRSKEDEMKLKNKFDKKRNDLELKRSIFKSVYAETGDSELLDESSAKQAGRKRHSNHISEKPKQPDQDSKGEKPVPAKESNTPTKRKKRKRGLNHKKFAKAGVAPDRLLSYGLTKTKLKKSKLL